METRADKAERLFKEGYNCSQAVFAAFSDIYGVDTQTALKIAASFGAGMGRMREVCGAVSGAFMVAGLENGSVDSKDVEGKKANYDLVNEIANEFKAETGSIICRELLGLDKPKDGEKVDTTPEARTEQYYKKRPCSESVRLAASIVEKLITDKKDKKAVKLDFMKVIGKAAVAKVADIAYTTWNEHYSSLLKQEQIDYMLDKYQSEEAITSQMVNDNYEYYLLENDEAYIGYVGLVRGKDKTFVSKIYVLKEFRHQGYGQAAMDKIKDMALADGSKLIYLTVNKYNSDSIKAYEKFGFIKADSVVTDIGNDFVMDDYIMEWRL